MAKKFAFNDPIRALVVAMISLAFPAGVSNAEEQPITGSQIWNLGGPANDCTDAIGGPLVFGYLPEPTKIVTEVTTAAVTVPFTGTSASVPVPLTALLYSDGMVAPITDVLFTMRLASLSGCFGPQWELTYSGGEFVEVMGSGPNAIVFEAVAVRQMPDPTGVEQRSFGMIKGNYRD